MWKNVNGELIHVTDTSRVKFRTNISRAVLEKLGALAEENHTYANYMLETGLQNLLADGSINYNKKTRPKDRVQYKTTYDKELLAAVKKFAADHDLFINDVIEYSINFIDLKNCKDKNYKHRIEKIQINQ